MVSLSCTRPISILLTLCLVIPSYSHADDSSASALPETHGMMTFFYYDNHEEAVEFYTRALGFRKVLDDGWIVIVEAAPGSRIALANAEQGSLPPVKDKGALIAIETRELEQWFELLKSRGIEFISGWEDGDYVQQFRIYDPGGYIVEFVRWHEKIRKKFGGL